MHLYPVVAIYRTCIRELPNMYGVVAISETFDRAKKLAEQVIENDDTIFSVFVNQIETDDPECLIYNDDKPLFLLRKP